MGFVLIEQDVAVLPTGLLPAMKRHLRIDGNDDDAIQGKNWARRSTASRPGQFPDCAVHLGWTPSAGAISATAWRGCRIAGAIVHGDRRRRPVADYAIDLRALDGVPVTYLAGAFVAGMSVRSRPGFASAARSAARPYRRVSSVLLRTCTNTGKFWLPGSGAFAGCLMCAMDRDLVAAAGMTLKNRRAIPRFRLPPHPRRTVRFHAGVTYTRVHERAAQEIERGRRPHRRPAMRPAPIY